MKQFSKTLLNVQLLDGRDGKNVNDKIGIDCFYSLENNCKDSSAASLLFAVFSQMSFFKPKLPLFMMVISTVISKLSDSEPPCFNLACASVDSNQDLSKILDHGFFKVVWLWVNFDCSESQLPPQRLVSVILHPLKGLGSMWCADMWAHWSGGTEMRPQHSFFFLFLPFIHYIALLTWFCHFSLTHSPFSFLLWEKNLGISVP